MLNYNILLYVFLNMSFLALFFLFYFFQKSAGYLHIWLLVPYKNLATTILLDSLTLIMFFICFLTFVITYFIFLSRIKTINTLNYLIFMCTVTLIYILCLCCIMFYNLFLFYIFFELILIPMFYLIGKWGSKRRKIRAAYLFLFYTAFSSFFLLLLILIFQLEIGNCEMIFILNCVFPFKIKKILWFFLFLPLATKIPILPFHLWLPEAHVEASTEGSIILAGILLKLGSFGLLRYLIPIFPSCSLYFAPIIFLLSILSVILTSMTILRQYDLKKIIAYSSVAHMNLMNLGLFSFSIYGIIGSIYSLLTHAIVSTILFTLVGTLYDRHHTRNLQYYSGLTSVMPKFATFMFIFLISNLAFPGTSPFVGELLILTGVFHKTIFFTIVATAAGILTAAYSIICFCKLNFGQINLNYSTKFYDLNKNEFIFITLICLLNLYFGLFPQALLEYANLYSTDLLYFLFTQS